MLQQWLGRYPVSRKAYHWETREKSLWSVTTILLTSQDYLQYHNKCLLYHFFEFLIHCKFFFLQFNNAVGEFEGNSGDGRKVGHPDTRWNARQDVKTKLGDIAKLLEDMASETSVSVDTQSGASCLLHNMQTLSFLTMMSFLDDVLSFIDRVQKRLQCPGINFNEAWTDIQSLQKSVMSERDSFCKN